MGKYLAIYNGVADETAKSEFGEQQQREFMAAWGTWAQAHQYVFIDSGSPLTMKKRVTAQAVEDFTDSKTGYAIVEAGSHDEAVQIFAKHPHLSLIQGNSIEVLECPPVPGQPGDPSARRKE